MNPIFDKLAYWLAFLDTCIIEYPSALDALCFGYDPRPDVLDDRLWAIGEGGR